MIVAAVLVTPPASAAPAERTVTITSGGKTVTARLHPVTLRAPGFEVLLQKADGTMAAQSVGGERAWLGSVDGDTAARASGIVRSDGVFEGSVVFDRGETWFFRDSVVYNVRGGTPTTAFKWPADADANRMLTTAPGQAGSTTYRYDLGFDLTNSWFTHAGTIDGSVAKALDAVEFTAVSMLGLYETNTLLRPAVKRVVIRGDAAKDPYGAGATLEKVKTEWETNQSSAGVDNVVLQHNPTGGGGVAWIRTAGTPSAISNNAGAGANPIVIRHEVGHNWGAHDNHSAGPEGPTVESGNQYDRFDGTEVSAIFRYRDLRQSQSAPFTAEPTFAEPLPPYAALDLVDDLDGTVPVRFTPTANDHDANGEALSLASVESRSNAGGTLTQSGNVVTYTPPAVTTKTVDWAKYVVRDASGKTATGVALLRVDPFVAPPAPSTWPNAQPAAGTYELRNAQSGLIAAAPVGATGTAQLVQRPRGDDAAAFTLAAKGTGYELRNKLTGLCADVEGSSTAENARVLQYSCHGSNNQIWRVATNPGGGTSLINVSSGKCLAPLDTSVTAGAALVQVTCGLSPAHRWELTVAPVSEWAVLSPSTTKTYELINAASGLRAGIPAGSTGFAGVVLRDAGVGTKFDLVANPDGTHLFKEQSVRGCIDDSAQGGSTVGLWYCTANGQQSWTVRQHPLGGVALVNKGNGECLGTEGDNMTAGTKVSQEPCSTAATRRWTLAEVGAPTTTAPTTTPAPTTTTKPPTSTTKPPTTTTTVPPAPTTTAPTTTTKPPTTTTTPPAPSFFENTTDVAIGDFPRAGVTSPIAVNRPGKAPSTLQVGVRIIHPYSGDLVVELIAPDGTVYLLQSRVGGSADNIIKTFTVNASSEVAAGTWKLRVTDRWLFNSGKIGSWSLTF